MNVNGLKIMNRLISLSKLNKWMFTITNFWNCNCQPDFSLPIDSTSNAKYKICPFPIKAIEIYSINSLKEIQLELHKAKIIETNKSTHCVINRLKNIYIHKLYYSITNYVSFTLAATVSKIDCHFEFCIKL